MWHQAIIQSRKQLSPTVTGLTLQIIHQSSTPPSSSATSATTAHSNSSFTFLPGQWVDFQPHPTTSSFQQQQPPTNNKNKTIGGYSITSIPNKLPFIDLAIQSSRHPVAMWVTCHAEVNDLVNLRVGGSFMYDNSENSSIDDDATVQKATANDITNNDEHNDELMNNKNSSKTKQQQQQRLLFIAGGVGINPLFSMIQQWYVDQQKRRREQSSSSSSRAVLLYSAKQEVDLLFVTELNAMVGRELSDLFRVVLTTTTTANTAPVGVDADNTVLLPQNDSTVGSLNGNSNSRRSNNILFRNGRVDHDMIKDAVRWINNRMDNDKEVLTDDDERKQELEDDDIMIADQVYICGPPGMPEDIQRLLIPSSLQKDTSIRLVRSEDDVHYEKWW